MTFTQGELIEPICFVQMSPETLPKSVSCVIGYQNKT